MLIRDNAHHGLEYGPGHEDSVSKRQITEHITSRWIQKFMQQNGIFCWAQVRKLILSPAKQEIIEKEVSYHLGVLKRELVLDYRLKSVSLMRMRHILLLKTTITKR